MRVCEAEAWLQGKLEFINIFLKSIVAYRYMIGASRVQCWRETVLGQRTPRDCI